jgi:hypothetical protein
MKFIPRCLIAASMSAAALAGCDTKPAGQTDSAVSATGGRPAPTVEQLKVFDDSVERMLGALTTATDTLKARVEVREIQLNAIAESSPAALARLGNFVADFKRMQVTLRAKDDTIQQLRRRIVALTAENRRLRRELLAVKGASEVLKGRIAKSDSSAVRTDSILKRTEAVRDSAVKKAATAYVLIEDRDELVRLGIAGKSNRLGLGRIVLKTVDPSRLQRIDIYQTRDFEIPAAAKDVEVLSSHPSGSYVIAPSGGGSRLRLVDPDEFWSVTKVLVIMMKS